ncbi:ATP-binding cassette domain-containing protein [Desulfococcus sp.]|uniref:ATP-binding cassette domain-containing protein n=1 Tax=Desulfococcus sp. TaxID=2025834 RepID=UPI003593E9D7
MNLLNINNLYLGFGGLALLEDLSLQIDAGERVCLVGRNGTGKSTLIRLIAGDLKPDSGEIQLQHGARVSCLSQAVPRNLGGTILEVVLGGMAGNKSEGGADEWEGRLMAETMLSRMALPFDADFKGLSAGIKRRTLLARALAAKPDILLLDEPTNHLDMEAIAWLETFLLQHVKTLLFVTHDRMFLQNLATRIIELDRGRLINWACDYATYLARKEAALSTEANQRHQFDKKLAREETWIRQGVKARRTRNEGRVRALRRLREERRAWRERIGSVSMMAQEAQRTGKLVIEARDICFDRGERPIIRDLSLTVMRGDKLGIIGPNGAGKTTLLNILLGNLAPQQGSVRYGTHLETAYFDQMRDQLDETRTVQENVAEGNDQVILGGKPTHVIGYLKDFLFSPERARSPVSILSGGERNRLLLAKLFTKPANVLVLDEPTNDLDMETLELLESLLVAYEGTVLLVSHDRTFLNQVVTGTLVFEGDGRVTEYIGGYDDWVAQRPPAPDAAAEKPAGAPKPSRPRRERPRKLTYKERLELEAMPQTIEALEAEQADLHRRMADPAFYREDGAVISLAKSRLAALDAALEQAYARWEALSAIDSE